MSKVQLSPAQRVSSGETDNVPERVEISGSGAVLFGECGLDFSQKSNLFIVTGREDLLCAKCG